MISTIRRLKLFADQHARLLLFFGSVGVVAHNWRLWKRDRALAEQIRAGHTSTPILSRKPMVSVLVAAWNEGERIDAHIQSFLSLRYPSIELIICAGGADGTWARARQYVSKRVIVLEQRAGEGKQQALARCIEYASGEIIYLTDADCLYSDEALARLVAPIVEEGEQATTGGSMPLPEQVDELLACYIWSSDVAASARQGRYIEGLLGRNAAITRTAIEQSGGLNFVARTGTDYQLARRLISSGISIRFVWESVVPSEYPTTISVYWRKQSRWLRNLLVYGKQYGAYHQIYHAVRSAVVGAIMLLLPLLLLRGNKSIGVIWMSLNMHSICAKVRYMYFTDRLYVRRSSIAHILLLLPMTFIDFIIWLTPLLQMFTQKSRERW